MKELWQFFKKDISNENFTTGEKVKYGVVLPLTFLSMMIIAGWIENL